MLACVYAFGVKKLVKRSFMLPEKKLCTWHIFFYVEVCFNQMLQIVDYILFNF